MTTPARPGGAPGSARLRRTRRLAAAAAGAGVVLLVPACSADGASPTATSTRTGEQVRDELVFTFTGQPGPDGCRYDGPRTTSRDPLPTMVNESDSEAQVTFARLAPGATASDFDAYLRSLGAEYPVHVPRSDHDPAAHAWMDGQWHQIHLTQPGATQRITTPGLLTDGDYVAFCFRPAATGGGSDLWPVGLIRVADEG